MAPKTNNTFLRMILSCWRSTFLRMRIKRKPRSSRRRRKEDRVDQHQFFLMKRYSSTATYLSNRMISMVSSQFLKVWTLQIKMQPSWWTKQGSRNLRINLRLHLICLVRPLMFFCRSQDPCIKMLLSAYRKWQTSNSSLVITFKQSSFKPNVS